MIRHLRYENGFVVFEGETSDALGPISYQACIYMAGVDSMARKARGNRKPASSQGPLQVVIERPYRHSEKSNDQTS